MKTVEESAVEALDGSDRELFAYLPYILQDLWEMGSDPGVIIQAVTRSGARGSALRLLDLGCGKGAVSIRAAEELGCRCFGIDAIAEFVREAEKRASDHGVDTLCTFTVGDIRVMVDTLPRHDVIVLGSIGPVFGNCYSTLSRAANVLEDDGIIILDDGYIPSDSAYTHPRVLRRDEVLKQIDEAGMRLVDEIIIQREDVKSSDDYIFERIERRCNELIHKHTVKKHLFEGYSAKQREENEALENRIICSTMVIKRQQRFSGQEA